MKKIIAQTATAVCIVFTVMMAWFLAMGYLFAGPSYGLNLTASLYGAASAWRHSNRSGSRAR